MITRCAEDWPGLQVVLVCGHDGAARLALLQGFAPFAAPV